jgi:methionyl-tRNA formyltransferase
MSNARVIFMGTPPFAVASLDALLKAGVDVAAVVTAPDRPAGRGQQLRMSAVKEYALAHPTLKDRILQPEKLKDPDFHRQLDEVGAVLYIVVAFRMLPEVVWTRPALGTINLHGSLLPDYRGAAPINWAVMNGERITGATTFFLRHEIDTGDMIDRCEVPIGPDDTAGDVHDRLMVEGAQLLVRTARSILHGTAQRRPQEAPLDGVLHHAPKLTPENCHVDISGTAQRVHDHVRGLSPSPGAWVYFHDGDSRAAHFKLWRTALYDARSSEPIGTMTLVGDRVLLQCGDGHVRLLELQPEGKRRMDAAAFFRGLRGNGPFRLA